MGWVHVKASRVWWSLKIALMTHLLEKHQKCDLFLLFTLVVQTCWARCLMRDKLSWCSEKRLLYKHSRIHFLNYQNIENPKIHQNKELQIAVNILLTEQNKKFCIYFLNSWKNKLVTMAYCHQYSYGTKLQKLQGLIFHFPFHAK